MAAPPPAYNSPPTGNPDRRPLPEGWITRWDDNYHQWYYVDTRTQPPRSSWEHPLGPPSSPQQPSYAPPSNPPPPRGYNSGGPSYPNQYSGTQQYNNQPSQYPGYQGSGQPDGRAYQGMPPQGGYQTTQGNYGYPTGYTGQQLTQGGWQHHQPPQSGYNTQPQPSRGRGMGGLGTAAVAGVGGLVAGGLLANAFENHEEREREEAYDDGFNDGQVYDDFGGGGGDW